MLTSRSARTAFALASGASVLALGACSSDENAADVPGQASSIVVEGVDGGYGFPTYRYTVSQGNQVAMATRFDYDGGRIEQFCSERTARSVAFILDTRSAEADEDGVITMTAVDFATARPDEAWLVANAEKWGLDGWCAGSDFLGVG